MSIIEEIRTKFETLIPYMDERLRRLWAGAEAVALGKEGIKIEHRMFCHITENWRGRPLISKEVVVNLISNTPTKTGLTIQANLDKNEYLTGIKICDKDMNNLHLVRESFHGEWNYSIFP